METVRIGLVGEMRAGKDTVAELLESKLKGFTFFYAFSGGIHEVIKEYMPELYLEGKPRLALQQLGQVFRAFKPDVWIDRLIESKGFRGAYDTRQNIIVTDVRQPNEVKRLRELGFVIVKVVADKEVRYERIKASGDNYNQDMLQHETEILAAQCEADVIIDNSGSFAELKDKIDIALLEIELCSYEGGSSDE